MCVIGYFLKSGIGDSGVHFAEYIWGENGYEILLKEILLKYYGKDLRLLLIQYYVEEDYKPDWSPDKPRLSNYSNKNKDIAVAFSVNKDKFHNVGEQERRQFIVETTLQAVDLVEARLGKRKLDINFKRLREDVVKAGEAFIRHLAQ